MGIKDFYNKAKKNVLKVFGYRQPETLEELKALVNDPKVDLGKIDVSKVTSFEGLFKNSTRTDFSGIEKWDVSHVTNMRQMFYNAKFFNADIGGWDVSHVTAMSQMFYKAKSFSQDLGSWDMSGMKGHLNGRFLNNMFKHADKMNQRVFNEYMELGKQNIVPEERFNFLSVPRPRDYKKLIVPHTTNDVKEIFERLDDFAKMDTSAVTSLDHVLEDSKKSHLKEFESLDFSSVKSANGLGKNAENLNQKIPDLPDVMYANEVLKGATSYQQPVPKMDQVKQLDGLLADVPDYAGEIAESLKDANPKFVNNIFNQVDKSHLLKEIAKLPKDCKITASFVGDVLKAVNAQRAFDLYDKDIYTGIDFSKKFNTHDNQEIYKNLSKESSLSSKFLKDNSDPYQKYEDKFIILQIPSNTLKELNKKELDFPGIEIANTKAEQYDFSKVYDPEIRKNLKQDPSNLNTSFVLINKKEFNNFCAKYETLKVHNPLASLNNVPIPLEDACIPRKFNELASLIYPDAKQNEWAGDWKLSFNNEYMKTAHNIERRVYNDAILKGVDLVKNNQNVDFDKLATLSTSKIESEIFGEPLVKNEKGQYQEISQYNMQSYEPIKNFDFDKYDSLILKDQNNKAVLNISSNKSCFFKDPLGDSVDKCSKLLPKIKENLSKKGVSEINQLVHLNDKVEKMSNHGEVKISHGRGR